MLLSCSAGAPISSTNNSNEAQPRSNYSGICVLGTLSTSPYWSACSLAQSCLALRNPSDCSHPGSSVHGILPARILEWVAISFSRRYSWLRDWTHVSCVSCIDRCIFYHWATWKAPACIISPNIPLVKASPMAIPHVSVGGVYLRDWIWETVIEWEPSL